MAEWTRIVHTTIRDYLREVEIGVMRNKKLLALLQSRGRVTFDHSGSELEWKVRYKRVPIVGYADMDTLTFARKNRWLSAVLDWRGYAAPDMMSKRERLINRSTEAIVKVWSEMVDNLMEDMTDEFADELLLDGNASGRQKAIHGFESWLGDTGSEASAGFVYPPSDTYAGLSTVLGNYGGTWAVNGSSQVIWPSGAGDAHYDFFSPVIVKVTSANWQAGTKTWPNTCRESLRYGLIKGRRNKSKKDMTDLVMLDGEWYRQLVEKVEATERLVVSRGEKGGLLSLGFTDSINFDGVETTWDFTMPAETGYGIPLESLELCSLQKTLFEATGPDYDISTDAYRFKVDFFGNLKNASPRGWVKWKT